MSGLSLSAFLCGGVSTVLRLKTSMKSSPLATDKKSIPTSNTVQLSPSSTLLDDSSSYLLPSSSREESTSSSGRIKVTRQSLKNNIGIIDSSFAIILFCFTLSPIVAFSSFIFFSDKFVDDVDDDLSAVTFSLGTTSKIK